MCSKPVCFLQLSDYEQRRVPRHCGQVLPTKAGLLVPGRAVKRVRVVIWRQGRERTKTVRICGLWYVVAFVFAREAPHIRLQDTFMGKTSRLYRDTRNAGGGSNLDKLSDELQDVTRIMTKNMEELLWRGDSLDRTSGYRWQFGHS